MFHSLNLRLFTCYHQFGCQPTHFIVCRTLSTSQLKEYYDLLNITKSATGQEVKESFLRLSKIYHPDNKSTGSHLKFVRLKEAYDALKNGHPTPDQQASSYSSSASHNPYSNYDRYSEQSYRAHAYQRQKGQYGGGADNSHSYYNQRQQPGFGGPYANSQTPWEDLRRTREYYHQQQYDRMHPAGSALFGTTILLSAIAWMVIYGGLVFIWQSKSDSLDQDMLRHRFQERRSSTYQDYAEYRRMVKESEISKAARAKRHQEADVRKAERRRLEAERIASEVAARQLSPVGQPLVDNSKRTPDSPAKVTDTDMQPPHMTAPIAAVVSSSIQPLTSNSPNLNLNESSSGIANASKPNSEEVEHTYDTDAKNFGVPGARIRDRTFVF